MALSHGRARPPLLQYSVAHAPHERPPKRILVGTDFSEAARAVLRCGGALAHRRTVIGRASAAGFVTGYVPLDALLLHARPGRRASTSKQLAPWRRKPGGR
jgi:hypothetical protein